MHMHECLCRLGMHGLVDVWFVHLTKKEKLAYAARHDSTGAHALTPASHRLMQIHRTGRGRTDQQTSSALASLQLRNKCVGGMQGDS